MRLLDSDIIIDLQRGHKAALTWFAALPSETVAVSGYAVMELVQSARNEKEAASADGILNQLARVWPSAAARDTACADFRALHLAHGLGLIDALIAATAKELGATLCTFNAKHFRMVPGLRIEQPYSR
jgi:predicted nucleic acid-binding protein